MTELIILTAVPLVLLVLALATGRIIESSHSARLDAREAELAGILITDVRSFPGCDPLRAPTIIIAEAVYAADFFKNFIVGIRKIFGGELGMYSRLMAQARREAIVRLKQQAKAAGYNAICNVRLDFADIAGATRNTGDNKSGAMAAILASGTAYLASSNIT